VAAVISDVVNAQLVSIHVEIRMQVLHMNEQTLQICFHYEKGCQAITFVKIVC